MLRRRLDLLNEDAQQRARGRRICNITHTNTVTTSTKKAEGDPLCAAPRLEPPVQVHHPHHHAEDVAMAVAEHVDGLEEGYNRKTAPFLWYSEKKHHEPWQTTTPPMRGYSPCVPHPRCHRCSQGGGGWSHHRRRQIRHQKSPRSGHAQETSGKNQCGAMGGQ